MKETLIKQKQNEKKNIYSIQINVNGMSYDSVLVDTILLCNLYSSASNCFVNNQCIPLIQFK